MLKIGQNWGKIANYPLNAQQRSAPLDFRLKAEIKTRLKCSKYSSHVLEQVCRRTRTKIK